MGRYIHQGQFTDLSGNAVSSGTITVYLAGTTTLASSYTASSGGIAVNSVTSDSTGKFVFYVDTGDYAANQYFKIVLSKSGFLSQTYDDIVIFPEVILTGPDKVLGRVTAGAGVVEEIACTAAGRALLDDANAAAQLTTLSMNLKPVVNASVNKLDIFTKSGNAVPDATHVITVAIPDGNGFTYRSRAATYLLGTSQFILADAANYWSKGSLDGEIKNAYVYAIWDANGGIVWALGGYSGFTRVPASITATDDDFFLLEAGSTYTKVITDYCVCVGKIRYQYDTADAPDHTIQATVLDAPQVIWNPRSDYGYSKNLVTTNTSAGDIAEYSVISVVVKQSKRYLIFGKVLFQGLGDSAKIGLIRTGSATYASAIKKTYGQIWSTPDQAPITMEVQVYLNAGDTIHLGAAVTATTGNRLVQGDDYHTGSTILSFYAID